MQIVRETNVINIKNKMTEIRRKRKGKIYNNYFNNCDKNDETFVIYGSDTVVFWEYDNDIIRGYFYSCNEKELIDMLKLLPKGTIVDYLTKTKGELQSILENGGLNLIQEMHRMSTVGLTEDEKYILAEKNKLLLETLYRPQNARSATLEDLDSIYLKLYDVFDVRESHLPTKEELAEFITNKWVAIYVENNNLLGFLIFTVENGQFYGYQIWNGTGPEGYFTLGRTTDILYNEYLKKNNISRDKVKPGYCWVNVKNKKSMRVVKFWGNKFDGLYDFVYEKI